MAKVKLTGTGNSNNPAIFSPHPPSGDDVLFLNNFSMTCVAGGYNSFASATDGADVEIAAVAGGFITNLTTEAIDMNFAVNGLVVNNILLRLLCSAVGVSTWTGTFLGNKNSTSTAAINNSSGGLIVNIVDVNQGGNTDGWGITWNNPQSNANVIINIANVTNITGALFRANNSMSATSTLIINLLQNPMQITTIIALAAAPNNLATIIVNGIISAYSNANISLGTAKVLFSGGIDLTSGSLFPITGTNYVFDDNFFIKTRTTAGIENLLYTEQYPDAEEVTYDVVFDYGNKKGKRHNPPLDMVAKGVQSGLGVGTAEMLRVSDVLDALRDSNHESAEHFRNTSTNQSVQAQLQAALNS